jgi:hypothetical protein
VTIDVIYTLNTHEPIGPSINALKRSNNSTRSIERVTDMVYLKTVSQRDAGDAIHKQEATRLVEHEVVYDVGQRQRWLCTLQFAGTVPLAANVNGMCGSDLQAAWK